MTTDSSAIIMSSSSVAFHITAYLIFVSTVVRTSVQIVLPVPVDDHSSASSTCTE